MTGYVGGEGMVFPKLNHAAARVVDCSLRFIQYRILLKVHNVCARTEHPSPDKKCSESFRLENKRL